jgi:hypothetical protein
MKNRKQYALIGIITLVTLCAFAACATTGSSPRRISVGNINALVGGRQSGPPPAGELAKVTINEAAFRNAGLTEYRGYQYYAAWQDKTRVFGVLTDVDQIGLYYSGLSREDFDELQGRINALVNTEDYRRRDGADGSYDYFANHNGGKNAFSMSFFSRASGSWKAGDLLVFFYSAPWDFTTASFRSETYK